MNNKVTEIKGSPWFNEIIGDLKFDQKSRNRASEQNGFNTIDNGALEKNMDLFTRLAQFKERGQFCQRINRVAKKRKTVINLAHSPSPDFSEVEVQINELPLRKQLKQSPSPQRTPPPPINVDQLSPGKKRISSPLHTRIPSPVMRRLQEASKMIKRANLGQHQRKTIFLPGMLINNKGFLKQRLRNRSTSLKKAREHIQLMKVRGEQDQKPGIKEAFVRLVKSDEGDVYLGDFYLKKKFLKRNVLKHYVEDKFPERISEKVMHLVELIGPNFNLKKFGEMSRKFIYPNRRLKHLAFQIYDLDNDGYICIKDIFQLMNAEGFTDPIIYQDLLAISKKLNEKRKNEAFVRKKSTIIHYKQVKNPLDSQSKWFTSKSERGKNFFDSQGSHGQKQKSINSLLTKKMHDTFSNFCADLHQNILKQEKMALRNLEPSFVTYQTQHNFFPKPNTVRYPHSSASVPQDLKQQFSLEETFNTYMREKQYCKADYLSFEQFCEIPFTPFLIPQIVVQICYYLFNHQFESVNLAPIQASNYYKWLESYLFNPRPQNYQKQKRASELLKQFIQQNQLSPLPSTPHEERMAFKIPLFK